MGGAAGGDNTPSFLFVTALQVLVELQLGLVELLLKVLSKALNLGKRLLHQHPPHPAQLPAPGAHPQHNHSQHMVQ